MVTQPGSNAGLPLPGAEASFNPLGTVREPAWDKVLALPGANLHLYGKEEPRHGRKMGHLTVTAANAQEARSVASQAAALLGIAPFQDGA